MKKLINIVVLSLIVTGCASVGVVPEEVSSPTKIIENSADSDWRTPDPENVLLLELPHGKVVIELAPEFAPGHVSNIKALVREQYFDGLAFYRVAQGFVAQAGDPEDTSKPIKTAKRSIPAELYRDKPLKSAFTVVDRKDGFASETGYVTGFPVARNTSGDEAWLTHCPGAFAMARDSAPDSGGATFYIVIGHAPRYLDRNTTVFGRVLQGLEYIQQLRRGYGPSGVIQSSENFNPITSMRVLADLDNKLGLEVMRTDTTAFKQLIQARANRPEEWFYERPNYVDVCGVPVPVRQASRLPD